MKALFVVLTLTATFLASCDRQTLDGLRLQIRADVQSDYEGQEGEKAPDARPSSRQPLGTSAAPEAPEVAERAVETPRKASSGSDPDGALPFNPLEDCSQGGIAAQTNAIFYQRHSGVKSIDSKDQQLVKEWKAIQAEVEKKCR